MLSSVEIHQAVINTIHAPSNNSAMISRALKSTAQRKGPVCSEASNYHLTGQSKNEQATTLYTNRQKSHPN